MWIKRQESSIEKFAELIGTLITICAVVQYDWLCTKRLEREKCKGLILSDNKCAVTINIPEIIKTDLRWWGQESCTKKIRRKQYDRVIYIDTLETGWVLSALTEEHMVFGVKVKNDYTSTS
ncbi:hypothetical protein KM043_017043 [Ampulex compressa]|nr:hypothetical protein KM043_017043 [Ampulex compressa]